MRPDTSTGVSRARQIAVFRDAADMAVAQWKRHVGLAKNHWRELEKVEATLASTLEQKRRLDYDLAVRISQGGESKDLARDAAKVAERKHRLEAERDRLLELLETIVATTPEIEHDLSDATEDLRGEITAARGALGAVLNRLLAGRSPPMFPVLVIADALGIFDQNRGLFMHILHRIDFDHDDPMASVAAFRAAADAVKAPQR